MVIYYPLQVSYAGVAQLAEQLICNQQVDGSTPFTSSNKGEFPSGQRGQTVNLLSLTSVVRIHHPPPEKASSQDEAFSTKSVLTDGINPRKRG